MTAKFCPNCGQDVQLNEDGAGSCDCGWEGTISSNRAVRALREAEPNQGRALAMAAVKEIMAPLVANLAQMAEAIGSLKKDLSGIRQEMCQARQDRTEGRRGAITTSEWDEHERNFQAQKKGRKG